MNPNILEKLSAPVFDLEEAWRTMREAGQELVIMQRRIDELTEYNRRLKDHVERLSLDLGLKDYLKSTNNH